uniref:Major facilitator superfamily (MFS) profile domain-containing protein n=1 Tax=Anopheles albimanus TaxID=7167 RepID=A0A182FKB7_ANOAL
MSDETEASQECLDQYLRPKSLFSEDIEIPVHEEDTRLFGGVYHPSIPDQRCRAPLNAALLAEFENSGSLFSIQSAPVVTARTESTILPLPGHGPLPTAAAATMPPATVSSSGKREAPQNGGPEPSATNDNASLLDLFGGPMQKRSSAGGDTLLRPSSLALDAPYNPIKTHTVEPQPSTELDEDDNENLLTVSSLTARPLIAKSREIRSKKQKFHLQRQRKQVTSDSSEDDDDGPPDGGYGWIIVFGAFSVQFWVAGLVKSYGVLYVEIMENFPNSSATTASWIPAILSALCLVLAPLSSALCQRFSCRIVVIIGGVFCGLGLTLSYFATSLYHLLFTFGILTGIGGGLSTTPGIVIVSQYFEKHRALANGITISGTAAGSFVFPMLIERLIHLFGFHGTLLILGGCMLHVCVSGALYRPLEKKQESKDVTQFSSRTDFRENLGHLSSSEDHLSKRCLEDLFLDDQNRNSLTIDSKIVNITEKTLQESEDELKDILSSAIFLKPISSIRSCSILHSVEDLSTDSTCVYKNRVSGYDSKRNSMRYRQQQQQQQQLHHTRPDAPGTGRQPETVGSQSTLTAVDGGGGACGEAPLLGPLLLATNGLDKGTAGLKEVCKEDELSKMPTVTSAASLCPASVPAVAVKALAQNNNRGLSKSMIIPTPVGDLSEIFDDDHYTTYNATLLEKISQYLDITLLQEITFILMCLSVALMSVGCPYMLYYLPAFVISAGYTKSEAGYLVAVSAALDLVGRLALGWLSDLDLFDRKKAYIVCILGAGTAVLTIPSSSNAWFVIVVSAGCYGLCLGSWYLLVPVLLADLFGTERISSSYGLVRMFQSVGAISVPPLAGLLRDVSGGYEICFYCMGVCMVLGSVPLLVIIIRDSIALKDKRLQLDRIA